MKTAFLFSGQGAQYCGMGKELYSNFPAARAVFDQADDLLDFSMKEICFEENETIHITEYTQPAILTFSTAVYAVMKERGIKPDFVAGLSLGEYTAHVASGTFSFEQALPLVRKRGEYMSTAVAPGKGAMVSVMGMDRDVIADACEKAAAAGYAAISNYNAPGQIVIAGQKEGVEKAVELLKQAGGKRLIPLNVSGPFHTTLLQPAAEKLRAALQDLDFNEMQIPVVSNVSGKILTAQDDLVSILSNHVISPVLWEDSIRTLLEQGVDIFVELGPGKTLSSFVKRISKEVTICNVENPASLEKTLEKLQAEG